ncbi:cupin domain-containing protein [Microbacterium sp. HMH0099]|uniref:cupin domain-containing protein n=1 Tax=Microbacterium sp. HMH0099 TaxID=3414026 RepID=UPI003BF708AD
MAGTETPDVVELWDWTLAPGERQDGEAHSDGTRELLHVQEGTVTVEVDGDRYDLAPGDALSFHGDTSHSYVNSTDASARFSLTVFEPGVGAAHRTETPDARHPHPQTVPRCMHRGACSVRDAPGLPRSPRRRGWPRSGRVR